HVERALADPLRGPLLHVDEHDARIEVTEAGRKVETAPTAHTERRADERHSNVLHAAGDAAFEVNREQLVDGVDRHRVRIEPEHAARRSDAGQIEPPIRRSMEWPMLWEALEGITRKIGELERNVGAVKRRAYTLFR